MGKKGQSGNFVVLLHEDKETHEKEMHIILCRDPSFKFETAGFSLVKDKKPSDFLSVKMEDIVGYFLDGHPRKEWPTPDSEDSMITWGQPPEDEAKPLKPQYD